MYFLIIPIVLASLFVFGISKAYQAGEPIEILLEEQPQQNEDIINRDTIPTKKEDTVVQPQRLIRKISSGTRLENPLVILDGVQKEKAFNDVVLGIPSEEIKSIEVLKDESATAAYGKKGEKGVIIITSKEKAKGMSGKKETSTEGEASSGKDKAVSIEVHGYSNEGLEARSEKSTDTTIVVQGYGSIPKSNNKSILGFDIRSSSKDKPLVIIEGKEVDEGSMQKIDPDLIESISVFKGKEAIEKYRVKGKNGVIVIELKKDTPL
jgi:TonB-dependent SusC/RagA subfamily outer membrane receptor